MQLDIEKDVKNKRSISVQTVIFIRGAKRRWVIKLPRSMVNGLSFMRTRFFNYYSLQHHRRKEHGAKKRKPSDTVAELNKIVEEEGEDGEKLKEELSAFQHFLVDREMKNGRHRLFNFQMSKLDTKKINEKLEEVFNKLDSAAKINIALGFVLRNIETGEYRYFYAHETILCLKKPSYFVRKRI